MRVWIDKKIWKSPKRMILENSIMNRNFNFRCFLLCAHDLQLHAISIELSKENSSQIISRINRSWCQFLNHSKANPLRVLMKRRFRIALFPIIFEIENSWGVVWEYLPSNDCKLNVLNLDRNWTIPGSIEYSQATPSSCRSLIYMWRHLLI